MLKRTLFFGMIAACFVVNVGYASNYNSTTLQSNCNTSCANIPLGTPTHLTSQENTMRSELPKDLIFKVVIGNFVEPLDIECSFLRKVRDDLTIEKTTQGTVRYAIGAFREYKRAESHCESLKAKGYRHAKVIAYSQEEVLTTPMKDLLELIQTP